MNDEISNLAQLEGKFFLSAYSRWFSDLKTIIDPQPIRDKIQAAIEEDPQPLADFEEKVKRHVQRELVHRAVSEFRHELEDHWKKHGDFVADT